MITATEKERSLNLEFLGFIGTTGYFRYSVLFPHRLTDGTKHVAEKLGFFWFYDVVLSYQTLKMVKGIHLQRWVLRRLVKDEEGFQWEVALLGDRGETLLRQGVYSVHLTDRWEDRFDVFTIFVSDGVVFLPSEY